MLSHRQRKKLGGSLCICCCCALIFGIIGLVYYENSFLDIKHECEIYYIYQSLCQYACGTVCSRRLINDSSISPQDLSSESSDSHSHCHTRYCWGYKYVYEWKTMDWMYQPYKNNKIQTTFVENSIMDKDKLHSYIQSPFNNQTAQTRNNLKLLLDYLNNQTTKNKLLLSDDQIKQTDLVKYLMHTNDIDIDANNNNFVAIANFLELNLENSIYTTMQPDTYSYSTISRTMDPDSSDHSDVNWCDWKRPAYSTYGSCSSWPFEWYSLGDSDACWTDAKCSSFSTLSPLTNWDSAKGFGFASIVCMVIFVLILLYWLVSLCYDKLCGYIEYDRIDDGDGNDDTCSDHNGFYGGQVQYENYALPNQQQVIFNQQMAINNEMLQETEGGVDIIDEIQYDGNYTIQ